MLTWDSGSFRKKKKRINVSLFRKNARDGLLQIVWYYLPASLKLTANNKCHSLSKRISITEKYWMKSFPRRHREAFGSRTRVSFIFAGENFHRTELHFHRLYFPGWGWGWDFPRKIPKPFPPRMCHPQADPWDGNFPHPCRKETVALFGSFSFIFDRLLATRKPEMHIVDM